MIFKCQKKKIFRYENEIYLKPTDKKFKEIKYVIENRIDTEFPTLEAVFDLADNLMKEVPLRDQHPFDGEYLESQKRIVGGTFFNPDTLPWFVERDSNDELTQKSVKKISDEQKDFEKNKVKFAFALADYIPKVRHQTLITHKIGQKPKIVQVIYNGCKEKEDWKKFLKDFRKDLIAIIKLVSKRFIDEGAKGTRYNLSDFVNNPQLKISEKEIDYIENLLSFAKWLGYLKYEGTFLPMGVELYLQSKKEIRHEESNSKDKQVHEEFETTQKLRELRLIALECLAEFDKKFDKEESKRKKDKFITDYFACKNEDEIISLIIQNVGENHPLIDQYRDEALLTAVYGELIDKEKKIRNGKGLSAEQIKVYEEAITSNVQVIAGPGSGKTHTLTLRVARLIHAEKIQPQNILVLAYNRAVVVELKERLTKLFSSLGYANIIQRLKVFTFHGFCKFCLRDAIRNLEFAEWIPKFIETARSQPGVISNQLGVIKYVFVDEFQDITNERLELLKLIANPTNTFTTVIGDPNQSIYGYERVNERGSRSPKDNYDKFASIYKPVILRIGDNFRSYPQILTAAEKLLAYNQDTFDFVPLRPTWTATHNYREIIPCDGINDNWLDKLRELIEEVNPATGNKYRQVAIMFRRNVEIYRAYNLVEKKKQELNWNIRMRIQGEGEDFTRTREVAWVLDNFYKPKTEQRITSDFIEQFRIYQASLRTRFPNWDFYYLNFFECLLHEFSKHKEDDSTYKEFLEFVQELAQKDDGQLSKIYYNHLRAVIGEDHKTEIVLTTMHKVKGLEFDAVIIPASFTNLPLRSELETLDEEQYRELVEEERRLMYVAYTRAKYRLVAFYGEREKAMMQKGQEATHKFAEGLIDSLGISIDSGIDKFFISWGATDNGNTNFDFIEGRIRNGQEVVLKKAVNNWFLENSSKRIAFLNNDVSRKLTEKLNGFTSISGYRISNVIKWTFADTEKYDSQPKKDKWGNVKYPIQYPDTKKHWTDIAKQRGYIYLIEFSGYGTAN